MEHLTKQQIVLLTLLVSFITSIATGIFTVTLMQQAPPAVTQTINKIVERTVEKIVPVETQKAQIVRQEVTTVIKEDDLVVSAVEKSRKSLVRIYGTVNEDPTELFLGLGIVVTRDGVVVTDRKIYAENASYAGKFSDGAHHALELVRLREGEGVAFFRAQIVKDVKAEFTPADLSIVMPKLGQKIIGLQGEKKTTVVTGIVTGLAEGETPDAGTSTPKSVAPIIGIETNLPPRIDIFGSPLVNLDAQVIGLYTGESDATGRVYLPVSYFKMGLSSTTESVKSLQTKVPAP